MINCEDFIMERSRHNYVDNYGYRCEVELICDDIVVFDSTPKLSFDLKEYGIKIKHSDYYDYLLRFVIKDEQLFLCEIETCLSLFCKNIKLFGVTAEKINNGSKWRIFRFDDVPADYTGTLNIGKTFDLKYWQHDEKAIPVPFRPDVYKENGHIKFEKGKIVEKTLFSRE